MEIKITGDKGVDGNLIISGSVVGKPTFDKNLLAINELSNGLGAGIINPKISDRYISVLNTQATIQSKLIDVSRAIKLNQPDFSSISSKLITPVSAAIADIGLTSIASQKLATTAEFDRNLITKTGRITEFYLDTINKQQNLVLNNLNHISSVTAFKDLTRNIVTPTQMIATGISDTLRASTVFPISTKLPTLEITLDRSEVSEDEVEEHQRKLDALLIQIEPKLISYRKGAWDAYNSKGRDYIGQSFSSIRRLVDNVLRSIGPDEAVKETEYFKSGKGQSENSRPTREARMRYALGEKIKHERIKRLVKHISIACNELASMDHNPNDSDSFIYGTLIFTEGLLLTLLGELEI